MNPRLLHVLPFLLWGCGASSSGSGDTERLTVLAASSLTNAFPALAEIFEAEHPGVKITLSFAGSQALATQVRHGLAADVLASANAAHVEALVEDGLVEDPQPFVANTLVLALAEGYTDAVDLEHLPQVGSLVVGASQVPVGRYTDKLLDAAQQRFGDDWRSGVEARIVSREPSVRLAAAKVAMGEADAAIIYSSDAASLAALQAVPLPEDLAPRATYFQARLEAGPSPDLAREWMAFVAGQRGQEIFAQQGFSEVSVE